MAGVSVPRTGPLFVGMTPAKADVAKQIATSTNAAVAQTNSRRTEPKTIPALMSLPLSRNPSVSEQSLSLARWRDAVCFRL